MSCFTNLQSAPAGARICRLIDSCITQLKAQGPSRTCNESKEAGAGRESGVLPGELPGRRRLRSPQLTVHLCLNIFNEEPKLTQAQLDRSSRGDT